MKKAIKIKLVGFWPGFDWEKSVFGEILQRHYDVRFCEDPDYVFCSFNTYPFEFVNFDCVRIGLSWDTFSPNFNQFDYFMSHDQIVFEDRALWLPCFWDYPEYIFMAENKHKDIDKKIIKNKDVFCDLIYRHGKDDYGYRKQAFDIFNRYKPVVAGGLFLNNMPHGEVVTHGREQTKLKLQQRSKFSLAIESISHAGYISEKIVHPFAARSIPIYCGHPKTAQILNPKAYINCADYDYNWEHILKRVIELDQNEDEYLSMLEQPAFADPCYATHSYQELEKFLTKIFDQPPENSYRRLRDVPGHKYTYCPSMEESWLKEYNALCRTHAPFHEFYKRGWLKGYLALMDRVNIYRQHKK